MQLQGNNVFKQFMIDNFIDGNEVYENIIRGANYSPANNIINEVKPVDKTVTKVVEEDPQGSVETMYVGNPSGYGISPFAIFANCSLVNLNLLIFSIISLYSNNCFVFSILTHPCQLN